MMAPCAIPADAPLVSSLLGSVDCVSDGLLTGGYAALASAGGPVATTITGLLTLFVGFYAYRLLLGRASLNASDITIALVKIGLVLVLAGNWAVYQNAVVHTLVQGPQALANLLVGSGPRNSVLSNVPLDALQQVFDEMMRDVRSLGSHAGDRSPLLGGASFATMILNSSAYGVVLSSAGMLAATRIGLALLLALGPAVVGFVLFNSTRGLAEGWLRALIALALLGLTTTVLLSVEMRVLESALIGLARERAADAIKPETAMKVSFVIAIFLLAKIGAGASAFLIARGLRLPMIHARQPETAAGAAAAAAASAEHSSARSHVERIAAASGSNEHQSNTFRSAAALSLERSVAAGDRYRGTASSIAPALAAHSLSTPQRAVRPRRELLVARRKR